MGAVNLPPVPTYTSPAEVDEKTGKYSFNPTWLNWFIQLGGGLKQIITDHNGLQGLQGGTTAQYYHLTLTQYNNLVTRVLTAPSSITPGASPYSFHNTATNDVDVIVKGGTVSLLEFSRDGSTWYDVGVVAGMFHLSPGDYLRTTYTVVPTMTQVSR